MYAIGRQGQIELNIGKAFINTITTLRIQMYQAAMTRADRRWAPKHMHVCRLY